VALVTAEYVGVAVQRSTDALLTELDTAAGTNRVYNSALAEPRAEMANPEQRRARRIAELLALCLRSALLLQHAPAEVTDACVATRLGSGGGQTIGTLPRGTDTPASWSSASRRPDRDRGRSPITPLTRTSRSASAIAQLSEYSATRVAGMHIAALTIFPTALFQ
jgi:hypothetical protein